METKSLLEKFNIPLEHLSYEYISSSNSGEELQRIVIILRSGEEGVYPELLNHAERRLFIVKPSSVVLRKETAVVKRNSLDPYEREILDTDINNWILEMKLCENDLKEGKNSNREENAIRKIEKKEEERIVVKERKKIGGFCDYEAWEKYDPDTEMTKIDLSEEQGRDVAKDRRIKIREIKNLDCLTSTELSLIAGEERAKGNEAFRAKDYEEALELYDSSIKVDPDPSTYNNRAMVFIKLKNWERAIEDCDFVLGLEFGNVKALLRRAFALEAVGKDVEALKDYETVLKIEPGNLCAVSGVGKLRKECSSTKIRMKIQEVHSET